MTFKAIAISVAAAALTTVLAACPLQARQVIHDFQTIVAVSKDGELDIDERIDMDFGTERHHGIFRTIPVRYSTAHGTLDTPLSLVSVTADEHNTRYNATRQFNDYSIRIGNPDMTISGRHVYRLHYKVLDAINIFDKQPEIYWNATGNEWPFKIERADAAFVLPDGVDGMKVQAKCFQGVQGSKDLGTVRKLPHQIDFAAADLEPGQGLTFVLRLPPGTITLGGSGLTKFRWFMTKWWPAVVIPSTVFLFMFTMWWTCGRDPGDIHVAGVDWNPPAGLSPAEVGTLIDERCDISDIVSTLVDLAARGYLTIEQVKSADVFFSSNDYVFTKSPTSPDPATTLKPYERLFLITLFLTGDQVNLSQLKYRFYEQLGQLRDAIYESLTAAGYFAQNPEKVRGQYQGFGIIMLVIGVALVFVQALPWAVAFGLAGFFGMAGANAMHAHTRKGVEACRQAYGFQRFVMKAEKDRLRVLADKDPTIFGRLLPYAMVMGAADQWATAFKDILTKPPDWYQPYGYNSSNYNFNSIVFINDLGDGMRTCASTFAAAPPEPTSGGFGGASGASGFSFGGGFSGGGFGGGGGGSW